MPTVRPVQGCPPLTDLSEPFARPSGRCIRWHGRGGQGAITAAKIVASAAFETGYEGVVMAPTFGTERRGAPVFTSLKISREKIYDLSPIATPDMVVVLGGDGTMLHSVHRMLPDLKPVLTVP